ncbi:four-carbon acid sugar kinase family protein [Thermoanaerobacterium thermosaccharolyticum]|uniref:four-carbon acid sugar kinase family protein n=1 Tax=Thermoanaerobacterium thermosaccharolyticum TaxID=1517 RepID=UPI001783D6C9|nr:four-carbon acid sugar kinase family protein [Thermoanaerobacterium thermosaccharolyticum]MBE0229104.1 four-carbon acid sugar kinase family protein [Thermoanaerobacterium thermosaccharolyticum]
MENFIVFADDFTGANDTGVQFKKRGIETYVTLYPEYVNKNSSFVIDTETRDMNFDEAYNKVKEAAKILGKYDFKYVYKKVDSTLRGNIGAEIKAIEDEYKPDIIIFAPAYPDNNRTTLNGIQLMNGVPITKTEIANDPKKPVKQDNIKILLENEIKEKVIHYYLNDVRSNNFNFSQARVFSFDILTNNDMISVIASVLQLNKKVLWVGSAGLANALLKVLFPLKPVLSIVGSISEVSRKQVQYLAANGSKIIKIDISSVILNNDIKDIINESINSINEGNDTVLVTALSQNDYINAIKVGEANGMKKEDVSRFAQSIIGKISKEIITKVNISGVFLTGGDTAISFIKSLNSTGSKIIDELLPGIPLMELCGEICDGLKVVTKAGAFGTDDSILYCIQKLKELK